MVALKAQTEKKKWPWIHSICLLKVWIFEAVIVFQTLSFNASPLNFCLKLLYKCLKQCLYSKLGNNSLISSTNPCTQKLHHCQIIKKWKTNEKHKKKKNLKTLNMLPCIQKLTMYHGYIWRPNRKQIGKRKKIHLKQSYSTIKYC